MGENVFAYLPSPNTTFRIKNIITKSNKTIRVFDYPIPVGATRDLLKIPGISESEIRASLLKGMLLQKIQAQEIEVVDSDIDLLQFNDDQKAFLRAAGVIKGLEVTGTGGISASDHEVLRQLIHFIDNGPADGFASGAFRKILPTGSAFPTSIVWYTDSSATKKIVEKLIVYNINSVPSTITWNMYDTDGVTIIHTVVDSIIYSNNVFESTRTRSII